MCRFQLGYHLSVQLLARSSTSKAQLQCNKLCCNLSAWLQLVSSAAICQAAATSKLSSTADWHLAATVSTKCALWAQLHTFRTSANSKLCISMYQSSCVLSAHWQFVCCLVFCHTMLLSSILLFLQSVLETGAKCSDVAALMLAGSSGVAFLAGQ